jgi:D-aminopeptidase
MIDQYKGFLQDGHGWAMPVVAETYDGLTNDICGRHIHEEHVLAAIKSAASGVVAEGNVGGGTGMMTYEFKGGTGTASRIVPIGSADYTIGVLVQSNFGARKDLTILGVPVGRHMPENAIYSLINARETGSIIVIIGSDIPMLPIQLRRVAKRAAIGIGRTGTAGGNYSGDIFLAFSIANDIGLPNRRDQQPPSYTLDFINDHYFDDIYLAAVQAVEEAVVNALIAAESMTTVKPAGYILEAIDQNRLIEIMRLYNRKIIS